MDKKKTSWVSIIMGAVGVLALIYFIVLSINDSSKTLGIIFTGVILYLLIMIPRLFFRLKDRLKQKARERAVEGIDYDKDILIEIDEEIDYLRRIRGKNVSKELISILENQCKNKESALELIDKYAQAFNKDLITRITNISNLLPQIEEYIRPFIKAGVVETEYPYDFIED